MNLFLIHGSCRIMRATQGSQSRGNGIKLRKV